MADADNPETGGQDPGAASQAFLEHLDKSGFFQQIDGLEQNLKTISGDLKALGNATIERMKETESLVAHVLAIEAVLKALLAAHPVDADRVKADVKARTGGEGENAEGNPAVLGIVDELLSGQGN